MPSVEDLRPPCCSSCATPARSDGRLILYGHGMRPRSVVVAPNVDQEVADVVVCWGRRYQCQRCDAVITVLPLGVMPRFLYSVAAIVMALLLVAPAPVGEGLSEAEAYDRQGRDAPRWSRFAGRAYRWRSLGRWAARSRTWWSGLSESVEGLLATFHRRAGSGGRRDLLTAAVASHALRGAMT